MNSISETVSEQTVELRVGAAAWPLVAAFAGFALAAAAVVVVSVMEFMPLWLGTILIAAILYLQAHINHEAVHSNISGAQNELKWLNEFIGHVGSFFLFLPFPAFRAVHLAHHRMTNHPRLDGDMWFARSSWFRVLLSCCSLIFGYQIRLVRLAKEGYVPRGVLIQTLLQRLLAVALVLAGFLLGFGQEIIMLWLLPALIAMPILAFMFAYVVHYPHTEKEEHRASNVLLVNKTLQPFFTAIFLFQNYHLVHHLHPRVPFYRYGEMFRQLRPSLEARKASIKQL